MDNIYKVAGAALITAILSYASKGMEPARITPTVLPRISSVLDVKQDGKTKRITLPYPYIPQKLGKKVIFVDQKSYILSIRRQKKGHGL